MRLRLAAPGAHGIGAWSLRGLRAGELDGLVTRASTEAPRAPAPAHPNGAVAVDHVVAVTGDLERTVAALANAGLEPRRRRDAGAGARQVFFRVGEALLELVGPAEAAGRGDGARFWGLTVVVADLDAAARRLGPLLGAPREAVQPGRRIAAVRREAGLGTALALMTPPPAEGDRVALVLAALRAEPGLLAPDLAERTGLGRRHTTMLLMRLAQEGLVTAEGRRWDAASD